MKKHLLRILHLFTGHEWCIVAGVMASPFYLKQHQMACKCGKRGYKGPEQLCTGNCRFQCRNYPVGTLLKMDPINGTVQEAKGAK